MRRHTWLWVVVLGLGGCGSEQVDINQDGGSSGSGGTAGSGGSSGSSAGSAGTSAGAGTSGSAGSGAVAGSSGTGGSAGAASDICKLPQVVGPCEAAIPRWWFNAETGKCEQFIYGGCQGNENNFESAQACVDSCAHNTTNACDAIDCGDGMSCVFAGDKPVCAAPCSNGNKCPVGQTCGCGASCPNCKDCIQVCLLG